MQKSVVIYVTDTELWERAKRFAELEGISLSKYINNMLVKQIGKSASSFMKELNQGKVTKGK